MKFLYFLLVPLGFFFLSSSCNENVQAELLKSSYLKNSSLNEFSSQTHVPGMESNIRKTIKYTVDLNTEVEKIVSFKSLLVDSVKIPFSGIIVDGENRGRNFNIRPGSYESIQLICNRLIYIPDHPNKIIEEIYLEPNVMNIKENEGYLLYQVEENFDTMFLGKFTDKEAVIHP
jgi:hypothetical protein